MIKRLAVYATAAGAFFLTISPMLRFSESLDAHLVTGWFVLSLLVFVGLITGVLGLRKNAFLILIGIGVFALLQSLSGLLLNLEDFFLLLTTVLIVSVKLNFSDDAVIMAVRRGVITGVSTLI
ncbi:MAG: hypothetical protein ACKO7B_14390, partial [Flavobacteriales bacterium]